MNYMDEAIKEAKKAFYKKEVPIGAIIVFNNKIIGRGYNNRINKNDVMAHAEIEAIHEANNYLNDWRLDSCDLYVTLEPCNMCMEVIKASRIKNVYYLLPKLDYKKEYNKTNKQMFDTKIENVNKYKLIMSDFFQQNCKR